MRRTGGGEKEKNKKQKKKKEEKEKKEERVFADSAGGNTSAHSCPEPCREDRGSFSILAPMPRPWDGLGMGLTVAVERRLRELRVCGGFRTRFTEIALRRPGGLLLAPSVLTNYAAGIIEV